jgi:hypothetical protein
MNTWLNERFHKHFLFLQYRSLLVTRQFHKFRNTNEKMSIMERCSSKRNEVEYQRDLNGDRSGNFKVRQAYPEDSSRGLLSSDTRVNM